MGSTAEHVSVNSEIARQRARGLLLEQLKDEDDPHIRELGEKINELVDSDLARYSRYATLKRRVEDTQGSIGETLVSDIEAFEQEISSQNRSFGPEAKPEDVGVAFMAFLANKVMWFDLQLLKRRRAAA